MRRVRVVVLIATASVCGIACVPWISNLTRYYQPPARLADYLPSETPILVLPLWHDSEPCNVRRPFVTTSGELAVGETGPKSRYRLGLMGFDGHGPSHFRSLGGVAVVTKSGRALWLDRFGEVVEWYLSSAQRDALVVEIAGKLPLTSINTWQTEKAGSTRARFFGRACRRDEYGFIATSAERRKVIDFLKGIECVAVGSEKPNKVLQLTDWPVTVLAVE